MQNNLTRNTLAVVCIFALLALSIWVLKPFLAATVWAGMIVVATWPTLILLERLFGGRRGPAVAVMTLAMLLLLVMPLWWAVSTIVKNSDDIIQVSSHLAAGGLPAAPEWLKTTPLVGEKLATAWADLVAGGAEGLTEHVAPYATQTGRWIFSQFGGLGGLLIQFLLVILIAAILYASGEDAAILLKKIGYRLGSARGEKVMILAGQAIRGVALGVGVTAVAQTTLGGLGLVVAGVPFAGVLSAAMLMLCIAQAGPMLVLLPVVGWMYWQGDHTWATVLLIWSLMVASLDNILRPMLIRRGADLPLLLILVGVLGGLLTFGLIGIFVGPVTLAVTYTLMQSWLEEGEHA
jgi:predicted PurR-regulated permease PerM